MNHLLKKKNLQNLILATFALGAFSLAGTASGQNIAIVNGKAIPKSRADAIITTLQGGTEWQERAKVRKEAPTESYDPMAIFLIILVVFIIFYNMSYFF